MRLYPRLLDLSLPKGQSAFLWGPRKVGKSTFLKDRFPDSAYFDLLDYREADFPIRFWRTKSGFEVDFVTGQNAEVAIEVKGSRTVQNSKLKGMKAFVDEHRPRRAIVVSQEVMPRTAGSIDILPWQTFLERLWEDQIL